MVIILDSDMLSILQRRSEPACGRLEQRLGQLADDDVVTTIVTFQEQMRGWLAAKHELINGCCSVTRSCNPCFATFVN